jgi:hypothetical protein
MLIYLVLHFSMYFSLEDSYYARKFLVLKSCLTLIRWRYEFRLGLGDGHNDHNRSIGLSKGIDSLPLQGTFCIEGTYLLSKYPLVNSKQLAELKRYTSLVKSGCFWSRTSASFALSKNLLAALHSRTILHYSFSDPEKFIYIYPQLINS